MARLLLHGFALAVVLAAAGTARAEQDPTEETIAAADEAGVDALDLQGAVNSTLLPPRVYLIAVGELAPPVPPSLRDYAYQQHPDVARCIEDRPGRVQRLVHRRLESA